MANRTAYVGDTWPSVLLQVSDETGVLNLSTASSIAVKFIGQTYQFSATGSAIWPAQADPNGTNNWNLSAALTSGDTAQADIYQIFIVVTWSAGNIETFPCEDTFQVKALP